MRQPASRKNIIAATTAAALLAAAAAAQAQSYQISLNGGAFGQGIIAMPGEEVLISVWWTGGQNLPGFSGWSQFGIELHIDGAANIGGFQQSTGGIYTEDPAETMPNPSATATTGWNTALDTWVAGRRPGAGTAFGGALVSTGWRFSPSPDPVSFAAAPTANGFQVVQGTGGTPSNPMLTGTQGNSSIIPMFASEFLNTEADVEILRFYYTPSTSGNQTVRVDVVGATYFANGNFTGSVDASAFMLTGGSATIFIPAPGGAILLAMSGLMTARRRR